MLRILVVDDEPRYREILSRLLVPAGYEVHAATDALDALQALGKLSPAVAICDVHMPGSNGLWLADQIRAQSPTTAIVLATSDDTIPPFESLRAGVAAYILKPLQRKQVLSAVEEGCRWSQQQSARPRRAGPKRLAAGDETQD